MRFYKAISSLIFLTISCFSLTALGQDEINKECDNKYKFFKHSRFNVLNVKDRTIRLCSKYLSVHDLNGKFRYSYPTRLFTKLEKKVSGKKFYLNISVASHGDIKIFQDVAKRAVIQPKEKQT